MFFIEKVVLETLRLHGIVTSFDRVSVQDDDICGYTIPAGTTAWVSPYLVARNSPYWRNELNFNPDGFEDGDEFSESKKIAKLVFGYGAHVCLGQHLAVTELKLMVVLLTRDFHWNFSDKSDWRPENPYALLSPKSVMGTFTLV